MELVPLGPADQPALPALCLATPPASPRLLQGEGQSSQLCGPSLAPAPLLPGLISSCRVAATRPSLSASIMLHVWPVILTGAALSSFYPGLALQIFLRAQNKSSHLSGLGAFGDGLSSASILPFPSSHSFILTAPTCSAHFPGTAMLFPASMPLHMLSPDSGAPFPVGPLGTHPKAQFSSSHPSPQPHTHWALYQQPRAPCGEGAVQEASSRRLQRAECAGP